MRPAPSSRSICAGAYSQAYILTCKDGKRIALQMSSREKFWRGLAAAIEQPDLLERYPDRKSLVDNYAQDRRRAVRDLRAHGRAHEWLERLFEHDVPFAAEHRLSELERRSAGPPSRSVLRRCDHPAAGTVKSVHRAIRIDGSRDIDFRPPPVLGEHTHEVLSKNLGIADETLNELAAGGVIHKVA